VFFGEPSRNLHGGKRWFLQQRIIANEFYPSGRVRREYFAVRDDGDELFTAQLTDGPDLELLSGSVCWLPGDAGLSWIGRRWENGNVVEAGIYTAAVLFDAQGNAAGLTAQPGAPTINSPLVLWEASSFFPGIGPDMTFHDWSPNGTHVVYDTGYTHSGKRIDLRIATPGGGNVLLTAGGLKPVWCPDGSVIAFDGDGSSTGGIFTVKPNGSGRKKLIGSSPNYSVSDPKWSPTGSHLMYNRYQHGTFTGHLYRATASGGGSTNLTPEFFFAGPIAWR
jgi:hypothetical protein